jgi:hypothetical protein
VAQAVASQLGGYVIAPRLKQSPRRPSSTLLLVDEEQKRRHRLVASQKLL